MYVRTISHGLTSKQARLLHGAWIHAKTIGKPLNRFISFRPLDVDDLTPAERCDLFMEYRGKLSGYARDHAFKPTFLWSREAHHDGSGEHLHALVHVPKPWQEHFDATVVRWHPGPQETDCRPADYRVTISDNGQRFSAVGYITKQLEPKARWSRGLRPEKSRPVLGLRAGTTRNLGAAAQSQWCGLDGQSNPWAPPIKTPSPIMYVA